MNILDRKYVKKCSQDILIFYMKAQLLVLKPSTEVHLPNHKYNKLKLNSEYTLTFEMMDLFTSTLLEPYIWR